MSKKVRMNEIFLFGTRRYCREVGFDECVEMCKHLHPDGRYIENFMTLDEAENTARTGEIPDAVMERANAELLEGLDDE